MIEAWKAEKHLLPLLLQSLMVSPHQTLHLHIHQQLSRHLCRSCTPARWCSRLLQTFKPSGSSNKKKSSSSKQAQNTMKQSLLCQVSQIYAKHTNRTKVGSVAKPPICHMHQLLNLCPHKKLAGCFSFLFIQTLIRKKDVICSLRGYTE